MELPPSDGGNITLKMIQDAYAKAMEVCPPDKFSGWTLLAGPGFGRSLPLEVIDSQRIENGILNASLKIIESSYCTKRIQFRFPRSKKKRIRRKWAKDQSNWKVVPTMFLVDTNKLRHYQPPAPFLPSYFSH